MKIIIAGCSGKMGKTLLLHALQEQAAGRCTLIGGTVSPESLYIGKDLHVVAGIEGKCGIRACSDLAPLAVSADAVIDFTSPEYSYLISKICSQHSLIHVCGTTGLTPTEQFHLERSALKHPLLYSANMTLGITLLIKLIQEAAKKLDSSLYDADLLEMHHRHKVDAPSGTALMLGEAIASARNTELQRYQPLDNAEKRSVGSIGFSSVRAGNLIGTHEVIFAGEGETISFKHQSHNRNIYAQGAFKACYWMKDKPAGRVYSMIDVIG